MPKFEVTSPDGRKFEITAPEGTTAEEVERHIAGTPPPQAESALPESQIPRNVAAGFSRGVLGTLDLLPRGLAGAYNTLLDIGNPLGLRKWQGRPFSTLGAQVGLGTLEPRTKTESQAQFAGEMVGASMLPAAGAVRVAQAPMAALALESAGAGGAIAGGLVGEDVIGGPAGRSLGAIAGGFLPVAAPFAARAAVSAGGQAKIPETLAAAERQRVPITAGQAAGGSFLEKASATLPGGQRVATQFAERQARALGQRVEDLAAGLTSRERSAESAGRAISGGLQRWTREFKARGNQLYDAVDALIPAGTPTTLSRTKARLDKLILDDEFSAILDAPIIRQLAQKVEEKPTVAYETARALRSRIGDKLSSPDLIAGAPVGQLKSLYGAVTDDLADVARASGPMAERASERASRFWKGGMKRIDDFLNPIQRRKVPESVYKAAMAGTKEGASRIRALKKSLTPDQWNVVAGTVVRRLGRPKPSARTAGKITEETLEFSPETFATNLEGLDPAARRVLFSGTRYQMLERNLQDLLAVSQGIREQTRRVFNPSGTTASWYNAAGLAAPGLGAATGLMSPAVAGQVAGGLAANAALQRALQMPSTVRWLANPRGFTPSAAGQVTRLGQMLNL